MCCLFLFLWIVLCLCCARVGILFPLSSCLILILPIKSNSMPPRREPEVPAYVQQMMEAQAQLMQAVTQTITQLNTNMQNNNHNNNNNNPPPPPPPSLQQDRLTRFLRLNPPIFSSSLEPIVADDWLRTINKKLDTI